VAVVMFSHAAEIEARLDQSLAVVERLYGVSLSQTGPRWGGHAQFGWPAAASAGAGLPVGEAAGFQDMLLGFGIRIAMHSGALAARALDGATDYEGAWRRCIAPGMRASQINRAVYNRWRWASRALWAGVGALPDGRQALRCLYGLSPLHRLAVRCLPAGLVDGIGPGGGRA
jgi:flavin-dependent dehydrogenase